MNRFRLGAAILLLLLGIGLWAQWRMDAIHTPLAQAMARASQQVLLGQQEQAAQAITEVTARWQESRLLTAAFADHQPLEDIESLMAQLPAAAASDDVTDYAALCAELALRIQAVTEAHRLTLANLF